MDVFQWTKQYRLPTAIGLCWLIAYPAFAEADVPELPQIVDVFVRPDGTLQGRVISSRSELPSGSTAAMRVVLVKGRRTVAVATTGQHGIFTLQNLPAGTYQVIVDVPAEPIVRGQPPRFFPVMSLQQAATVAVIATGAVAAPVIYHNTLIDNRVPASP